MIAALLKISKWAKRVSATIIDFLRKSCFARFLQKSRSLLCNRVELLAACEWQTILQPLEELFQFRLGCFLDFVIINFEVVKGIRVFGLEILIVWTSKFRGGVRRQREFVGKELVNGSETLRPSTTSYSSSEFLTK